MEAVKASRDRGEGTPLLASRPKIDEELLARDVVVADLQEQLIEVRALIAKRRCVNSFPIPTPPPSHTTGFCNPAPNVSETE